MRDIVECVGDSPILRKDVLNLLIGEPISRGAHREVYTLFGRPTEVIKIETGCGTFYNQMEWTAWCELQDSKWSKFFAPCLSISDSGIALIMERTHPVTEIPKRRPPFLQDVKPENFGMLPDGRVVCHDYSISWLIRANLRRMKAA